LRLSWECTRLPFVLFCSRLLRALHSFPTRRSSDLWMWGPTVESGLRAHAEATGRTLDEVRAEIAARLPLGEIPDDADCARAIVRSEEHTSELQSRENLVCRLLLEKKNGRKHQFFRR